MLYLQREEQRLPKTQAVRCRQEWRYLPCGTSEHARSPYNTGELDFNFYLIH